MHVWHFSEAAYPEAWEGETSLRVTLPNSRIDPDKGADIYARHLDEWAACDELGLNIMVNEHHSTATCLSSACNLLLSILARTTKNARLLALGNPIANRPDPIRVAEEAAMIDMISRGRLDLGLVRGSPYEIGPTNANPVGQMDRFWESHDLIIKALSTRDGPFNWESENFHYRNVNIWPRPYQDPHPPIWITSTSPSSAPAIAKQGHRIATLLSGMIAKDLFHNYRMTREAIGLETDVDRFAYCALVGVGKTRAEGIARADKIAGYIRTSPLVAPQFAGPPGYVRTEVKAAQLMAGPNSGGLHTLRTPSGRPIKQTEAKIEDLIEACTVFAGTPDDVFEQIKSFHGMVGGFGHLLMMGQGGTLNHADTMSNLEMFSADVLPRLADLNATDPAIRAFRAAE
jgi:alkanesulfonate monooxygenase SsuD/methylene tetrahydromethanopterin reductase-like flavin-dependent oxidoreductase (luciferase family)